MMDTDDTRGIEAQSVGTERAGTSRRRFLWSTVGVGALALGASAGNVAGVAVTDQQISVEDITLAGGAVNEATVTYEDGTVSIDGSIGASDPCHTVEFGDVRFEGDTLFVPVHLVDDLAEGEGCVDALATVQYRAAIGVSEEPARVVVEHHSFETWQTVWPDEASAAPSPPRYVRATGTTSSSISLEWESPSDPGAGIDHYVVSTIWTDIAWMTEVTDTAVTLEDGDDLLQVSEGTTYDVRVWAVDTNGTASPSAELTVTPSDDSAPGGVENLSAVPVGPFTVELSWDELVPHDGEAPASAIGDHFDVYVDGVKHHEVARDDLSTTVADLSPETTYEFGVTVENHNGLESAVATDTATTSIDATVSPIDGTLPQDLDGDGRYRDVNGNGRLDSDDVVTFFDHIDDEAVTSHAPAYDFNGNGGIDFADVIALFEQV